jgi:hypothetical protein
MTYDGSGCDGIISVSLTILNRTRSNRSIGVWKKMWFEGFGTRIKRSPHVLIIKLRMIILESSNGERLLTLMKMKEDGGPDGIRTHGLSVKSRSLKPS